MRKTKRFTPSLLDRYISQGRGTGTYADYIPFHRVGRSDPSSRGRSHLGLWQGRHLEFLSDGERVAFLFASMLPNLLDVREQFPLQYEFANHELRDYTVHGPCDKYPGTEAICKHLGYKHPKLNGNGRSAAWTMTTDLLLTLKDGKGLLYLLAISCKPKGGVRQKRAENLLEIERQYWKERHVEWLLITPELYDNSLALMLRGVFCWSLGVRVEENILARTHHYFINSPDKSITALVKILSEAYKNTDLAQRALWQAIWFGHIPVDLRRSWRPHIPLQVISQKSFWELNPIASRRTAWI